MQFSYQEAVHGICLPVTMPGSSNLRFDEEQPSKYSNAVNFFVQLIAMWF